MTKLFCKMIHSFHQLEVTCYASGRQGVALALCYRNSSVSLSDKTLCLLDF